MEATKLGTPEPESIRVAIQQPSLAKYRVPVFRELAKRPGIRLSLYYGDRRGLFNEPPEDLDCHLEHLYRWKIGPAPISWHRPQWSLASGKHCDVLVLTWNTQYLSLVPGLKRARRAGVGTVVWGHGYSKKERPTKLWLRKKVALMADAVLFYNRTTANRYINELNFPAERVFVASNSVDQRPIQEATSYWEDRPDDLRVFQSKHELDPSQTLLFVSRLHPDNRLDLLVDAVPQLTTDFQRLKVVIVGQGDEEQKRLQELAQRNGVADRLIFAGAIYDEMKLAPWFLSSTIFCYPANIGLSILHAFGYGLPVVTSDRMEAQNPEIEALHDGKNGLFYCHGRADDLAATIRRILSDTNLLTSMRAKAKQTIAGTYNVPAMVDGMETAIRFAFKRSRKPKSGALSTTVPQVI